LDKSTHHITVFEHETLRHDKGEKKITIDQYKALEKYYGEGIPYFSLCHNGIQFNEYVGVIQIGTLLIEVLPKADKTKNNKEQEEKWRSILIDMLKAAGVFNIKTTGSSHLKIKPNNILDLYFELFISEIEYLLHQGLVKQYRKTEGNILALKGSLYFAKHVQKNLISCEKFYVRHTTYDIHHKIHFILYKTLRVLKQLNTNGLLQSRIGNLLLHFPEMPDIKVSENTFKNIIYTRKTKSYNNALDIARLILLHYHPDIIKGSNHVLALMFDMNKLWEKYIYRMLVRTNSTAFSFSYQNSRKFWEHKTIRPDVVITKKYEDGTEETFVIDTKWKVIDARHPSDDDLKQMFAYNIYWNAQKSMLLYPKVYDQQEKFGVFHQGNSVGHHCKLGFIQILNEKGLLDKKIGEVILSKLE
jgi:5-methylcytosine-specific restriction enzyme subunit McrC